MSRPRTRRGQTRPTVFARARPTVRMASRWSSLRRALEEFSSGATTQLMPSGEHLALRTVYFSHACTGHTDTRVRTSPHLHACALTLHPSHRRAFCWAHRAFCVSRARANPHKCLQQDAQVSGRDHWCRRRRCHQQRKHQRHHAVALLRLQGGQLWHKVAVRGLGRAGEQHALPVRVSYALMYSYPYRCATREFKPCMVNLCPSFG
jgi:hypothetical protein